MYIYISMLISICICIMYTLPRDASATSCKLYLDGRRRTTDDDGRRRTTTTTTTGHDDDEQKVTNTFKVCSHIEFNTTNPNPIFKITIFYKITKNTKILSKYRKVNRLFTPQNRHAQTFPDTHRVQFSGAHLL